MARTHTDRAFEADLQKLRTRLTLMGKSVEAQIAQCIEALVERDSARCTQVIEADREVNRLEVEIDTLCRKVLALRQPAASDLRFITTALKIVTDLERVGDLAVNIAERVLDLNQAQPLADYRDIPRLASLAEGQLTRALAAFVAGDVEVSKEVMAGDDHLDALFLKVFNELLAFMMEDPRTIRRATALMFVAKHLERIGDHAVNVAEMTIYMVQGKDVRHPRSRGGAGAH
jgi:phosphate transport system protein